MKAQWDEIKSAADTLYQELTVLSGVHNRPLDLNFPMSELCWYDNALEAILTNMGWSRKEFEDACEAETLVAINDEDPW